MEELVIRTHNFEWAKNQLKIFSEETITDLDLRRVNSDKDVGEFLWDLVSGGGIGLGHKVTGAELNELTKQIQDHLIQINEMHKKFIKEFGKVYETFEALDIDYIQEILAAIKSAQEANEKAMVAQNNIARTVEEQKKIVKVLQQFKEKLDQYKHITDIDEMWGEFRAFQNTFVENRKSVNALEQFKNRVDKYKYLSEIDNMWEDNQSQKKDIEGIKKNTKKIVESVDKQNKVIAELLEEKAMLDSIKHLSEIDQLWQNVKAMDTNLALLSTLLPKQIEDLANRLETQAEILSSNEEILAKLNAIEHIYEVDDTWRELGETVKKVAALSEKIQECILSIKEGKKTVGMLSSKMQKIDGVTHLTDIDSMFDEFSELKEGVRDLKQSKKSLEEQNADLHSRLEEEHNKTEGLISKLETQAETLSSNEKILVKLDAIEHIYEVDNTWRELGETVKKVDSVSEKTQECISSIEEGKNTVGMLSSKMQKIDAVAHLTDVDSMFDELSELRENVRVLKQSKESFEEQNAGLHSKLEEEHNKLEKLEEMEYKVSGRIKMAYLLAGGSIGLAVLEFICVILGLI